MRKVCVTAIVAGVMIALFAVGSFAVEEASLKVIAMNGKALAKIYPSTEWTDVTPGQMLHARDVLSTGMCDVHSKGAKNDYVDANGNVCPVCGAVTLELSDKSTVSLKPDSEMSIDELVMDNAARKLKVNLPKGDLRMIIAKVSTPSDFSVKTPNAIYGAAGTVFYVNVGAAGTSVYVAEGSINVVNPITGEVYSVVAGMIMTFNSDGTVSGPAPASDLDISNWTACYVDSNAEPYRPPMANNPDVIPPGHTGERPVSGG